MGIDAQAFSKKLPKKRFGRANGRPALERINKIAIEWAKLKNLEPLFHSVLSSNDTLELSIYPLAEFIDFAVSKNGIGVSFRSSNSGPGYHAAVIDLLDFLETELQLEWNWGDSVDHSTDETGYASNRDFESLQWEMAKFLKTLMQTIDDMDLEDAAVCIPLGLGIQKGKLSAPRGMMDYGLVSIIADSSDEDLLAFARDFFPWWNKSFDRSVTVDTLTALMWQEAVWRAPVTDFERYTTQSIVHVYEMANQQKLALQPSLEKTFANWRRTVETDEPPSP